MIPMECERETCALTALDPLFHQEIATDFNGLIRFYIAVEKLPAAAAMFRTNIARTYGPSPLRFGVPELHGTRIKNSSAGISRWRLEKFYRDRLRGRVRKCCRITFCSWK